MCNWPPGVPLSGCWLQRAGAVALVLLTASMPRNTSPGSVCRYIWVVTHQGHALAQVARDLDITRGASCQARHLFLGGVYE